MNAGLQQLGMLDWAVAACPMEGQTVCGDLHLVRSFEQGVLVAVVDGVGHGEQARAAARAAVEILERNANQPVTALVKSCHEALMETRGVVMTVASLQWPENTMTWLGVGNVEGRLLRHRPGFGLSSESVLLRGGLVGYQIPPLYAVVVPIHAGDLMIFVSDGLQSNFDSGIDHLGSPQQIADRILARSFKGTDDGIALVVRFRGRTNE